jgi:hypothetical protein
MIALAVILAGGVGLMLLYRSQYPAVSKETVTLGDTSRARLILLRQEAKFEPNAFPPLGYTGPDTPKDGPVLRAAVNDFIDDILAQPDGPLTAREVSRMMKRPADRVNGLATEDRERTYGYLTEVWYILGFHGATGHFAKTGPAARPKGYEEPLPPGWSAPDQPRPIGSGQ